MLLELRSEMFQGAQHGIRQALSQPALRGVPNGLCQFRQQLNIAFLPFAFTYAFENLEQGKRSLSAGGALAAGFIIAELDKVLGSSKRTSLAGSMETALGVVDSARGQTLFGAGAELAKEGVKKARNINQEGAYKSMFEFLNKQSKKTKPKGK